MTLFRSWGLLLGLVIVFLAGVVLGVGGTLRWVQRYAAERRDESNWKPRMIQWLGNELTLTSEQATAIEPYVETAVVDLSGLRERAEAERRAILGRMLFAVNAQLDSVQQGKLREVIQAAESERLSRDQ